WGTKAVLGGTEFVFDAKPVSKKIWGVLPKDIFAENKKNKKPINVFGLFSKESQEIWLAAKLLANKRKPTKELLGIDIFSAILNRKDLAEIFQRLELGVEDAKVIIKNYSRLLVKQKKESLGALPFLALE